MGELVYDCYQYDSRSRATITNRSRQIPPASSAREWRGPDYEASRIGTYTDVAKALRCIEDEIAAVDVYFDNFGTWITPDRLGLIREAADALAGPEIAWQWRRDLSGGAVVVLAVRGYWATGTESSDRRPSREAASDPLTTRLRRPRPGTTGRRFDIGGPHDQYPNQ